LQEISIDDLTRPLGISRPAFYFYFPSKDAVLLALLDRVVATAFDAASRNYAPNNDDPVSQWRVSIEAAFRTFNDNRAVIVAAAHNKVIPRLGIERIDGEPVIGSGLEEVLIEAGFSRQPRRLVASA